MAGPIDWDTVARERSKLSDEDLEAAVLRDPQDLAPRLQLIWRYMLQLYKPETQRRRHDHIFWLIENHPDLPFTYTMINADLWPDAFQEGKRRWLAVVASRPNDPAVLQRASLFLSTGDHVAAAELLQRGAALEPTESHWYSDLAFLRLAEWFECDDEKQKQQLAEQSTAACERALALESDARKRFDYSIELVRAATMAGLHERAAEVANDLLAKAMTPGGTDSPRVDHAIHYAGATLKNAALARGDVATARTHLLAAKSASDGFPSGNSLGPDFTLATALLARGEGAAVIEYLDGIEASWHCPRHLQQWKEMIKAGQVPTFLLTKGVLP